MFVPDVKSILWFVKRCCYDGVEADMERLVGRSIIAGSLYRHVWLCVSASRFVEVRQSSPND